MPLTCFQCISCLIMMLESLNFYCFPNLILNFFQVETEEILTGKIIGVAILEMKMQTVLVVEMMVDILKFIYSYSYTCNTLKYVAFIILGHGKVSDWRSEETKNLLL